MDLKNIKSFLVQLNDILTYLKNFIKKHWGILIVLFLIYGVYWIWNLPEDEYITNNTEIVVGDTIWYEDNTYDIAQKGDTIWYNDNTYDIVK
jgi:hypothetical protein